jgi:hypothetical protein
VVRQGKSVVNPDEQTDAEENPDKEQRDKVIFLFLFSSSLLIIFTKNCGP